MADNFKRAALVGIDHYQFYPSLGGCVDDVLALEPLLKKHEDKSPNFACKSFTAPNQQIQRNELLAIVQGLLKPGADVALLYFAGHGFEVNNDVTLVTEEANSPLGGVRLSELMTFVQQSEVPEIVIILDCCFSGAAGGVPQLGYAGASLRDGVSMLTASRGDQSSVERAGRGQFSRYLCGALEGGAADVLGKVSIAGIYSYISESFGAFDQRPTFKANIERLHTLRHCRPAVPLEDLRLLPEIFPQDDFELPLDPSFEPTAPQFDPAKGKVMAILQKCRAAKLVEPIGEQHIYYAAMHSKSCRLTPLGRHYWRMTL